MVNAAHDIRSNGKGFICKKCGVAEETRDASVFWKACAADLYENRIHPSHRMKFTVNKNRPLAPDVRTCTACGRVSLNVDRFFADPCTA